MTRSSKKSVVREKHWLVKSADNQFLNSPLSFARLCRVMPVNNVSGRALARQLEWYRGIDALFVSKF